MSDDDDGRGASDTIPLGQLDPWHASAGGRDFDDVARDDGLDAVRAAIGGARKANGSDAGVRLQDFYAYMPSHSYIFAPTREFWPGSSVNSRLPPVMARDERGNPVLDDHGKPKMVKAATWLDQERPVEQTTWAPGEPMIVEDRLISEGGWIKRHDCSCFNLYRPPIISPGDASKAGPWLDHLARVYPSDADHIVQWLAQRVQRPHEKINHALVLGGSQGIGKDTILEPAKYAIGPWNFAEVSPGNMLGRFNGFLKSVILRVSEARDLGDTDRFAFYDHMKTYTAAPPDVLRVDEKHIREHTIFNVVGVVITTNHKSDGIFLPADDRRHYVAWSDAKREEFDEGYWRELYGWYEAGGLQHVAAFLTELDLTGFDPKAPPPKTPAFWAIVDASKAPEDAEMADALDRLGNPDAVTIQSIASATDDDGFRAWLNDRRSSRVVPHRLEDCGYVPVRNPTAKDGLWKANGRRGCIYAKAALTIRDQHVAAERLASRSWGVGR